MEPGKANLQNVIDASCGSADARKLSRLATILEAKINLEPLPDCAAVCVVHFKELLEAIRAVKTIVDHGPSAVEIFDNTVVRLARQKPSAGLVLTQ